MHSKHASLISFLLVIGAHAGVFAAVMLSKSEPKPVEIVIPTIQGMLVMAEPEQAPPPPPEPLPPPEKKPEPKPIPKPKPPPKAPPSEHAVKAPEPEPPPPVERPVEPKPAEPASPAPTPIVPPRAEAGQLSNPAPVYPSLSRRLREQGTVILEILIKANGTVGEIKIKQSSGFKRLDESAVKAVSRWRYLPATQDGQKIDFWYEQPVEFNLR